MNDFNINKELKPLNLKWSDSIHNYIGDINVSPYLSFHQVGNKGNGHEEEWEWTYCCTSSNDVDDDILFSLEQAIVSYIKWSAKQLEPPNDIEEDFDDYFELDFDESIPFKRYDINFTI